MAKKLSPKKAKQILHDKEVHNKPLTEKQRKFFGAVASGAIPKALDGIEAYMGGLTDKGFNYNGAWGGQFQLGGVLPGAIGNMYARHGAPSEGKYAKKTMASAAEGIELLPEPTDPERKYKLSAVVQSAKEILNPVLRSKDPKAYDAWQANRLEALRKGTVRQYDIDNPLSIYLTPNEVKKELSKHRKDYYEDYIGAVKGLSEYSGLGRESYIGGIEGEKPVESLNYGYRFATAPVNLGVGVKDRPGESFTYSYDPKTGQYKKDVYRNGGKMMSYYQAGLDFQPKTISKKGSKIKKDNAGYWNPENWGEPVEIDSNEITMEGVYQPLIGVSDTGDVQYMEPGENYTFDGSSVTEYPIARKGVSVNKADEAPLKKLDNLLNFTNYNDMKKAKKGKNIPKAQIGTTGINPNLLSSMGRVTNAAANYRNSSFRPQTPTLDMVMANAPQNNVVVDDIGGNSVGQSTDMSKFSMPGSLGASPLAKDIEFIGMAKQALKERKKAKQSLAVSEVVKQAATMRPDIQKRKYVRPEDNLLQPDQMGMMPYGTGYDVLGMAEDGMQIGGNLTEIQNMYNPGTLYDNLGYEPLDESSKVKQFKKGGGIPKAQMGIQEAGMELLSLGQGLRNQAILGAINRKTNKWTEQATQNLQQGAMAQALQTQFSPFMKNGGSLDVSDEYKWVSHSWQPQVITKFGEHNVKDLLKPDPMMNTLRTGGNIRSNYMGDDEMVRSMAMGGNLQTHWGGEGEVMSYNPYMPGSGETVMLKGNSHEESDGQGNTGVGMSYSGNMVEAERGEPVVEMQEGGSVDDTSAVVFGNMKIPSYGISELGDNKAKGKKFKSYAADLAKQEQKQSKIVDKATKMIDNIEGDSPYDMLKMNSAQAMIMGADMSLKDLANKKKTLAGVQNAILETAEEMGLESDALARGKIMKAKKGVKISKAQDGIRQPSVQDIMDVLGGRFESRAIVPPPFVTQQPIVAEYPSMEYSPMSKLERMEKPVIITKPQPQTSFVSPSFKSYKDEDVSLDIDRIKVPPGISASEYRDVVGKYAYAPFTTTPFVKPAGVDTYPLYKMETKGTPTKEEPIIPIEGTENDQKTGNKIKNFLSENEGLFSALYNEALPYLRPSNQMQLQPEQLAGEMFALSTNVLQGVPAQTYQPLLETRAPQMSAQEQLNQNQADFNAMLRQVGNNPAALGILAAQKQAADRQAIAQTQAYNTQQAIAANNRNIAMLNDASLKNLGILDTQYQRQEGAKANTKAQAQAALSSIASKIGQNKLENLTSAVMQNMYNFRFGPKGRIINYNPLAKFNIPDVMTLSDEKAAELQKALDKRKGKTEEARNGSIVKAIKGL